MSSLGEAWSHSPSGLCVMDSSRMPTSEALAGCSGFRSVDGGGTAVAQAASASGSHTVLTVRGLQALCRQPWQANRNKGTHWWTWRRRRAKTYGGGSMSLFCQGELSAPERFRLESFLFRSILRAPARDDVDSLWPPPAVSINTA